MKENVKTYITSEFSDLVDKLSNLKIEYMHDAISNEHLVKVSPPSIVNSEEYDDFENNFILNFIDQFPFESVVLFTDDDKIQLKSPDSILIGKHYYELEQFCVNINFIDKDISLIDKDSDMFDIDGILAEFDNFNFDNLFEFNFDLQKNNEPPTQDIYSLNLIGEILTCDCCSEDSSDKYSVICGENNFALAA